MTARLRPFLLPRRPRRAPGGAASCGAASAPAPRAPPCRPRPASAAGSASGSPCPRRRASSPARAPPGAFTSTGGWRPRSATRCWCSRRAAKNTIDGYLELVREGALCVIGPLITDNSIALAPVIDQAGVPAITWTGTDRYHGEYCFNLGNGGLAEEAAMMAAWIRRQGHRTVGMIHELSPGGVEYASNFRYYAARAGLDVLIEAYTTQVPDDLEAVLRKVRDQRPDCLAYLGYGYPTILMGPMFERLAWDPPRIMTSAFQFCYAKPEWMAALEGWHGIDQMCEQNPRLQPMLDRFAARHGKRRDHTVTAPIRSPRRAIAMLAYRRLSGSGWRRTSTQSSRRLTIQYSGMPAAA